MILLLGPSDSGKTTIVKSLLAFQKLQKGKPEKFSRNFCEFDELPYVIPTVGTNVTTIPIARKSAEIQEVGGCMVPIWKSYFDVANAIVFVIDASNPQKISSASVQLKEVIGSVQKMPILVLLNKTDISTKTGIIELKYLLNLNDIIKNLQQVCTVMEISCKNGKDLDAVIKWFLTNKLFS